MGIEKLDQVDDSKSVYQQFQAVFARYGDGLYYYVLWITGDEMAAKDIVQECFLRLWQNRQVMATNADPLPLLVTYIKKRLPYYQTVKRRFLRILPLL